MQAFSALRTLLPEFIHKDYDKGPFKLVCEDFGLANLIVRSHHDLTIIGVVDLEWSYAGPAQLAASPWWLLQSRLTLYDLELEEEEAKKSATILDRYLKYLDIFIRVLKQEERSLTTSQSTLSTLIEWSRESGAMWLHMLLHTGFNYVSSIPFVKLREHIGLNKWQRIQDEALDHETLKSLVGAKTAQLGCYDDILDKIKLVHDMLSRAAYKFVGRDVRSDREINRQPRSLLPTQSFSISARYQATVPNNNMTDSGGFVKVPNDEEEERMRKAAEESQRKREEARKKREMEEAMKKAGEDSQRRRRDGGATA
ncbi:hypothetical protein ZTR_09525 [Talaromyces verruculosus]|nr:hypothetical protein ZTR_09525 [Talaromyces verruculosus]